MDDVCFASAFEVCLSRHHDFMTAFGFYLVMQCVRRLATHSHMWVGVPCSTWVWMSRGSTRRCRLRARGSKKVRCVKVANTFIRRLCYGLLDCNSFIYMFWIVLAPAAFSCGTLHVQCPYLAGKNCAHDCAGWSWSEKRAPTGQLSNQAQACCLSMGPSRSWQRMSCHTTVLHNVIWLFDLVCSLL
jgi:hypothetical protein